MWTSQFINGYLNCYEFEISHFHFERNWNGFQVFLSQIIESKHSVMLLRKKIHYPFKDIINKIILKFYWRNFDLNWNISKSVMLTFGWFLEAPILFFFKGEDNTNFKVFGCVEENKTTFGSMWENFLQFPHWRTKTDGTLFVIVRACLVFCECWGIFKTLGRLRFPSM